MVLGLRSKNKKAAAVPVDYIIHLQEIKPWPPSQSLKSLRSAVLRWENGDRNSGSTRPVAPSISEGRIKFNESFKLHATLLKEASGRGGDNGSFQKNVLELNLFETRRDQTVKGQLLGSAAVDLAEHGVVKEAVTVSVLVNCKRSFRNTVQPVLYMRIQPYDKEGSTSSSRESLSKEASMDRDGKESVSALMTEEYAEEAEIASFTDDDVSSHSSVTRSSSALEAAVDSPLQNSPQKQAHDENVLEAVESGGVGNVGTNLPSEYVPAKPELEPVTKASTSNGTEGHRNGNFPKLSTSELSIDPESLDNGDSSLSSSPRRSSTLVLEESDTAGIHSSSSLTSEGTKVETKVSKTEESAEKDGLLQEVQEKMVDCRDEENIGESHVQKENVISVIIDRVESLDTDLQKEKLDLVSTAEPNHNADEDEKPQQGRNGSDEVASSHDAIEMFVDGNIEQKQIENGSEEKTRETKNHSIEIECLHDSPDNHSTVSVARVVHAPVVRQHSYLQSAIRTPLSSDMTTFSRMILGEKVNGTSRSDRLKNMKFSMRSTPESLGSITYASNDQYMEDVKEIDVQEDLHNGGKSSITDDRADVQENTSLSSNGVKHISRINRNNFSNNKVQELELKIEMLEGELREAAAMEIGLYSVVAEHGSSTHKVHTPARRLSRLYIHASKQWSRERRASAARSAVSGLVLAAKACGNDLPRLTFWLSNSVVLRAIITQSIGHTGLPISAGPYPAANGSRAVPKKKISPLKWESPRKKEKFSFTEDFDDWEDPCTFMTALERIETWIFSRIIESIWWQTFALHMQPINEGSELKVGSHSKKSYGRTPSLGDQQQANSSIAIWKKAFKDAYERLCPVRAGGHECGCLPMMARLVMEQCVARLDVAMFNAILRESDDEIPTDPVSDPISDSKVLPIPSGKLSFGAGAQLKNAIGNWSRWLTDLFGMDGDDYPQDENEQDDDRLDVAANFKSFHLLNALSDLLMLPKDMLLERSIRKEVCPTFGASLIKWILNSFLPDEFCPDPIPDAVLEALDSEDPLESCEESIRNFPCDASPIIYSPPSIASTESIIGDVRSASLLRRSRSSVVRKCHTSDDELDELDSPLASIVIDKYSTPTAKPKGASAVRYQLLREVWREDD